MSVEVYTIDGKEVIFRKIRCFEVHNNPLWLARGRKTVILSEEENNKFVGMRFIMNFDYEKSMSIQVFFITRR